MKVFNPANDKIAVMTDAKDIQTKGGLYIPATVGAAQRIFSGTVYAVGPLVTQFTKGDRVMYTPYTSSTEVEVDGFKYMIIPEKDILGTVTDNEVRKLELVEN